MQPLSFLERPVTDISQPPEPAAGKTSTRARYLVRLVTAGLTVLICLLFTQALWAHGVAVGDAGFIASRQGFHFWPYFYLGAKHMVSGYDHLLFLAGVIFFLYRLRDVAAYVTLFAVGHSLTLLAGVWYNIPANGYLIDAIIGLSVVYKAFENIGGFQRLGIHINTRLAVWIFGLCHGFGLATKLQELSLPEDGLLGNLLAFNLGVEAGQMLALVLMVALMNPWRRQAQFSKHALYANSLLMACGMVLIGHQLTGYFHPL